MQWGAVTFLLGSVTFSNVVFTSENLNSNFIGGLDKEIMEPFVVHPALNSCCSFPPGGAGTIVISEKKGRFTSNLAQLITSTPSIAQNGQGGHFQNFSIRGVSKQRIKTLINDVRIEGIRRAGASASFIEPLLINKLTVWRNPVSTQLGSGALGGAVNLEIKQFTTPFFASGYQSDGNENFQVFGVGNQNGSFGIARRGANNSYSANGTELNSHFTQYSAIINVNSNWQDLSFNFFALPAIAKDIGKSNIDFPERITVYPEEKHLLLKLGVSSESGWEGSFYIHPNNLETEVHKIHKSLNTIKNEALDLGTNWQYVYQLRAYAGKVGMDYFSRQNVNSSEQSENILTQTKTISNTLLAGEEHEFGMYTTLNGFWGDAEWEIGARYSYFIQSSSLGSAQVDDSWSGFFSIAHYLDSGWVLSANVASGFRFPSLTERFFSGTTGRGKVLGNPDLKKEQSINVDLGIKWQGSDMLLESHVFYLSVNDYIERQEIASNVLTFLNLNNGRIMGLELEAEYFATDEFKMIWSGHFIDGEDDQGQSLSDIPSNRVNFGLKYITTKWEASVDLELRENMKDPGNGEKKISSAKLLSAVFRYPIVENIQFSINVNNLLNEKYYHSADRKSTYAKERSFGINVLWEG